MEGTAHGRNEGDLQKMSKKPVILIVEDNEETAGLLSMFLESKGFQTERAKDGMEGADRAKKRIPDLILLDITMPKLDGKGVLGIVKSNPATRGIPVVMCTDHSALDEVEQCCKMGAEGYILKPFDMNRVLSKVNSILLK